ncbi:cytochrome P450 [Pilatotrama ljubarskyi]|nr:cytochrome P450 [Pilatotrama ljubarskyi]
MQSDTALVLLDVVLALVFLWLAWSVLRPSRASPPGPKGLPFVGVAYEIPGDKQWLKFHEWTLRYGRCLWRPIAVRIPEMLRYERLTRTASTFMRVLSPHDGALSMNSIFTDIGGDVVSTTVMGQPTLILGSVRAANDLLDNRGAIYSDRPDAIMAGELVGWNRGLGYAHGPDNPRFREFRRLFQQFIGPRACQHRHILSMQEEETHRLMFRFLRDPENFYRHPRESTGALILRLAYGYEVVEDQGQDPLVQVVEVAMQGFAKASEPGAFLVDNFPVLRYVPEWLMPGGGFKAVSRRMRRELDEMYDLPFGFVKEQLEAGKARPSFTSSYLEEKRGPTAADEELIKAAAASLYSGGADTTPSSMTAFILAVTLQPSIQARAQRELDAVLGSSWTRLPTFADRERLPYVNAIVLEVLRWNPAVPLGLAHRVTQDDVYRGWVIPKGTVVWANIWSMLQDPAVFPEPSEFRPERYLNADGSLRELERHEDPSIIGFGFGRRICPGMFFAMNSIFIGIATMLYVFDISKSRHENDEEIVPKVDFRGFISHPVPFKCDIRPRSEEAAALVRRATGQD